MGKKIRSEMEAQRKRFVAGAVERGVEHGQAEAIFELLARFADYGFNKSHAAAYALVAYQTAYMKANYPVEFLAASMTLDMGNTDKLAEFRAEAERLGIKVEPPSINRSGVDFEVEGNTIHYALAALKGVGPAGGRSDRRRARRAGRSATCRLRAPHQSARASTSACWKAWPPPAPSMRSSRTARALTPAVDAILAAAQRAHEAAASRPERIVRRTVDARDACRCRRSSPGCRPNGCSANSTRSASSSPAIRSTITRRC